MTFNACNKLKNHIFTHKIFFLHIPLFVKFATKSCKPWLPKRLKNIIMLRNLPSTVSLQSLLTGGTATIGVSCCSNSCILGSLTYVVRAGVTWCAAARISSMRGWVSEWEGDSYETGSGILLGGCAETFSLLGVSERSPVMSVKITFNVNHSIIIFLRIHS